MSGVANKGRQSTTAEIALIQHPEMLLGGAMHDKTERSVSGRPSRPVSVAKTQNLDVRQHGLRVYETHWACGGSLRTTRWVLPISPVRPRLRRLERSHGTANNVARSSRCRGAHRATFGLPLWGWHRVPPTGSAPAPAREEHRARLREPRRLPHAVVSVGWHHRLQLDHR